MHHVIIGAGPAGVVAAETLRRHDREAAITLIGEEPERPYSRMAIPYLLIERIDEPGTHLRHAPDHYEKHAIRLLHERVTAVDPATRTVQLAGGGSERYDRL
ncbi:MAG TPA: FAD-dependent oxidoreductase, partial [Candidatus Competibacteraceae bacterium]|nr:FAD-dependent oxidoreductase [Candidatus Competibacteraceae bacterium]